MAETKERITVFPGMYLDLKQMIEYPQDTMSINLASRIIPLFKQFGILVQEEDQKHEKVLSNELKIGVNGTEFRIQPGYAFVKTEKTFEYTQDSYTEVRDLISVIRVSQATNIGSPASAGTYYLCIQYANIKKYPSAKGCSQCFDGDLKIREGDSYTILYESSLPDFEATGKLPLAKVTKAGDGTLTVDEDLRWDYIARMKVPLIPPPIPNVPPKPVIYNLTTGFDKDLFSKNMDKIPDTCYITIEWGYEGEGSRDVANAKKFYVSSTVDVDFVSGMFDDQYLVLQDAGLTTTHTFEVEETGKDATGNWVTVKGDADLPTGTWTCYLGPNADRYLLIVVPYEEDGTTLDENKAQVFTISKINPDKPTKTIRIVNYLTPNTKYELYVAGISTAGDIGEYSDSVNGGVFPDTNITTPQPEDVEKVGVEYSDPEGKAYSGKPKMIYSHSDFENLNDSRLSEQAKDNLPLHTYIEWFWGFFGEGSTDATQDTKVWVSATDQPYNWADDTWVNYYITMEDNGGNVYKRKILDSGYDSGVGKTWLIVDSSLPSLNGVKTVISPNAWGYKLTVWELDSSDDIIPETISEFTITRTFGNSETVWPVYTQSQLKPGIKYRAKVCSLGPKGKYESEYSEARDQLTPSVNLASPITPKIIGCKTKPHLSGAVLTQKTRTKDYVYNDGTGDKTASTVVSDRETTTSSYMVVGDVVVYWGETGEGSKDGTNPNKFNISTKTFTWTDDFWIGQKIVVGEAEQSEYTVTDSGADWVIVDEEIAETGSKKYWLGPIADSYEVVETPLDVSDNPIVAERKSTIDRMQLSPVPMHRLFENRVTQGKYEYKVRSISKDGKLVSAYSDPYEFIVGSDVDITAWQNTQTSNINSTSEFGGITIEVPKPAFDPDNVYSGMEILYSYNGVDENTTTDPDFANEELYHKIPSTNKKKIFIPAPPGQYVKWKARAIDALGRPSGNIVSGGAPVGGTKNIKNDKVYPAIEVDLAGSESSPDDRIIIKSSTIRNAYMVTRFELYVKDTNAPSGTPGKLRIFPDGNENQAQLLEYDADDKGNTVYIDCNVDFTANLTFVIDSNDPENSSNRPSLEGKVSFSYREY